VNQFTCFGANESDKRTGEATARQPPKGNGLREFRVFPGSKQGRGGKILIMDEETTF